MLLLLCTVSKSDSYGNHFSPNQKPIMKYSILVLYNATNNWLLLSREERGEIYQNEIMPVISKFEGKLNVRIFDSEAFHAKTSDFMIIECNDLKDHYYFMEYLRDTSIFGKPYIELIDIVIGVENGFEHFEAEEYNKE